jgi:hypothetical protein
MIELIINMSKILIYFILMIQAFSNAEYNTSSCLQPPHGGILPNYQNPTFMREYGHQRIFIQGLTSDNYFFSFFMMITSPSIIGNIPLNEWKCGDNRIILFNIVYYDKTFQKYKEDQDIGFVIPNSTQPIFNIKDTVLTHQWNTGWIQNNTSNSTQLSVSNKKKNISFTLNNVFLTPQGTMVDQQYGPGFVPTTSDINAYSFNSLTSNIEGNINDIQLDKNNTSIYLESVATTENSKMFTFACMYLLDSFDNTNTMFLCGTLNGSKSEFSRGMIIFHNKTRQWLEYDDFSMVPLGKEEYSHNANTSFYREYHITVYNIVEFKVSSLITQQSTDFGFTSDNATGWTQEVNITWMNQTVDFLGSRGLLELMKAN